MTPEIKERVRERLAAIQGNLEAIKFGMTVLIGILGAYLWHVW